MSSYAALLEEYYEETRYANDTFTDIEYFMESVGASIKENVDFNITLNLNEVSFDDSEALSEAVSDKAKTKFGEAIQRLIKKIGEFVTNIGLAMRRLADKAAIIVSNCGNKVLAAAIKNKNAKIGKDITIKIPAGKHDATAIIDKIKTAQGIIKRKLDQIQINAGYSFDKDLSKTQNAYMGASNDATSAQTAAAIDKSYSDNVKTLNKILAESYAKSDAIKTVPISKGCKVDEMYRKYIKPLLDMCDTKGSSSSSVVKASDDLTKESIKTCNSMKKDLQKAEAQARKADNTSQIINAQHSLAVVSAVSTDMMTLNHNCIKFALSILQVASRASAVLALAAVDADGRKIAGRTKGAIKNAGKGMSNAKKKFGNKLAGNEEE